MQTLSRKGRTNEEPSRMRAMYAHLLNIGTYPVSGGVAWPACATYIYKLNIYSICYLYMFLLHIAAQIIPKLSFNPFHLLYFPAALPFTGHPISPPIRSINDSHLFGAVVVFAAHKTNYMCSNKRAGPKNKKTLGPIKTTPGRKKSKQPNSKQQTSNTICSNVRNYLSESEQKT